MIQHEKTRLPPRAPHGCTHGLAGSFNTCTGLARCKLCGYHVTFLRAASIQNTRQFVKGHFGATPGACTCFVQLGTLSSEGEGYEKGDREMKEMREIKGSKTGRRVGRASRGPRGYVRQGQRGPRCALHHPTYYQLTPRFPIDNLSPNLPKAHQLRKSACGSEQAQPGIWCSRSLLSGAEGERMEVVSSHRGRFPLDRC